MNLDLEKFIGGLHEYLAKALGPVGTRLDAIERRLDQAEAAPFSYAGPHEQGKSYAPGMFVSHDGSLWHCSQQTTARPGDGPQWVLAVKRGRDAR